MASEEGTLEETVDALELSFEPLDDDDSGPAVLDDDDLPTPAEEESKKKVKNQNEEEESEKPVGDEGSDEDEQDAPDPSDDKDKESPDEGDDPDGEEEGDDEPPSVVESVITSLGYEFSDEELEGLEDSEEGITRLVEIASRKASEDRFNQMVEASPNVKALYEYERAGGDPNAFAEAFYPEVDYAEVEVSKDDTDTQKSIIRESLKSKGLSDERIKRNLQAIEDSGNLFDEAKDSLTDLQTVQQQRREQIKEDTEKAQQTAREEAEQTWQKVEETVKQGNLKNIPLPKKQQGEFLEFIQTNPETGMSPRDEAISKMSLEEQLTLDAIVFHGLDMLNEIVDKKASSKSNQTLRERLKSQKKRAKSSSQDPDLKDRSLDTEELEFRIDA